MTDYYWKKCERKGARFFGAERNPLSGIGSGHDTHSDSLHQTLYLEGKSTGPRVKHRTWLHKLWDLWKDTDDKATREMKLPVLHLHMKGAGAFLVCVSSDDLPEFVEEYLKARGFEIEASQIPLMPEE